MAIIVDKVQKRKDIALSCKEIVLECGIRNLTISKLAVAGGVGKGTIYEYFENKEDIVFEIVNLMMLKHNERKEAALSKVTATKEKVIVFLSFFYNEVDAELLKMYKEFVSIALSNPNQNMIDFQDKCALSYYTWFSEIIETGIQSGELIPEAKALVKGLYSIGEGMFVMSASSGNTISLKKDITEFTDAIFKLIEVK